MPIARMGDLVATGHGCDAITNLFIPQGNLTVTSGGSLVARLGDPTEPHTILVGKDCVPHTAFVTTSSATVWVAGKPCARMGDVCDAGIIASGNPTVFVGG